MAATLNKLKKDYPWIQTPLIVGAPMRLIALDEIAIEVSRAGGIGFLAAGTDISQTSAHLQKVKASFERQPIKTRDDLLPIGLGFITWGAPLTPSLQLIAQYRPAAIWLFAYKDPDHLTEWVEGVRQASPETRIWIQIGSVAQALETLLLSPDILVVQGADAGGHGLVKGAGLIPLLPEVADSITSGLGEGESKPVLIAAGGIMESRTASAALALGASGVVLGTRLLATPEAAITPGYRNEVLRASDGGQTTVRTKVYDSVRGTTGWSEHYNARGVINRTLRDHEEGLDVEENKKLYEEEVKKGDEGWGFGGRMTTYAGAGVGLVREVKPAADVVREVREGVKEVLGRVVL
ncbi:oxidoreductase 2-nitropropane dioxygenase [Lophiotrema nucula]|uniref:Oxidoreductase 2-nitropropane dioxygenase n=1 Tax=Lophiotrema nucula TaxID=690887 RepID=A0A6A5YZ94_9PLEO|nr:oxidoreductase 2-nitropropane dioxygenase [Lophiotrema nucula]